LDIESSVDNTDTDVVSNEDFDQDVLVYEKSNDTKFKLHPKVIKLKEWLKSLEIYNLPRVECGSIEVNDTAIAKLDQMIGEWLESIKDEPPEIKRETITPKYFIPPIGSFETFKERSTFHIGDRIIYLKNNGSIPFGTKGTIVGINGKLLDILFDKKISSIVNNRKLIDQGSAINLTKYENSLRISESNVPRKN